MSAVASARIPNAIAAHEAAFIQSLHNELEAVNQQQQQQRAQAQAKAKAKAALEVEVEADEMTFSSLVHRQLESQLQKLDTLPLDTPPDRHQFNMERKKAVCLRNQFRELRGPEVELEIPIPNPV